MTMQRLFQTSVARPTDLKATVEKMEAQFEEYRSRSGRELAEDLRMMLVEQALPEPIRTHVSLNAERLVS